MAALSQKRVERRWDDPVRSLFLPLERDTQKPSIRICRWREGREQNNDDIPIRGPTESSDKRKSTCVSQVRNTSGQGNVIVHKNACACMPQTSII